MTLTSILALVAISLTFFLTGKCPEGTWSERVASGADLSFTNGGNCTMKNAKALSPDADGVLAESAPIFITAYGPKIKYDLICDPAEDKTQQSDKDSCDINIIMSRYLKTGVLPEGRGAPQFVDTTAIDFQQSADLVAKATGAFSLLSAEERDSYGNRVDLWLDHQAEQRAAEAAAEVERVAAEEAEAEAVAEAAAAAKSAPPEGGKGG